MDFLEPSTLVGMELRDDGQRSERVDLGVWASVIVIRLVNSVGILGAAVLVADTFESAIFALALLQSRLIARVGANMVGPIVGFLDVLAGLLARGV